MREILFRGKHKETKEWIKGSLVMAGKNAMIYPDNGYGLQFVIPETIGQYTGLRDKTGKRIFEGDVVVYNDDYRYMVFWDGVGLSFGVDGIGHIDIDGLGNLYNDLCEVIGNIHDRPELLEGV